MAGLCFTSDIPLRVEIIRPRDPEVNIECRVFGYVPVVLRAKAQSDASATVAWVFIEDLTN